MKHEGNGAQDSTSLIDLCRLIQRKGSVRSIRGVGETWDWESKQDINP